VIAAGVPARLVPAEPGHLTSLIRRYHEIFHYIGTGSEQLFRHPEMIEQFNGYTADKCERFAMSMSFKIHVFFLLRQIRFSS
jgi:hypothetical protein